MLRPSIGKTESIARTIHGIRVLLPTRVKTKSDGVSSCYVSQARLISQSMRVLTVSNRALSEAEKTFDRYVRKMIRKADIAKVMLAELEEVLDAISPSAS